MNPDLILQSKKLCPECKEEKLYVEKHKDENKFEIFSCLDCYFKARESWKQLYVISRKVPWKFVKKEIEKVHRNIGGFVWQVNPIEPWAVGQRLDHKRDYYFVFCNQMKGTELFFGTNNI